MSNAEGYQTLIARLDAENIALKAEVERLKKREETVLAPSYVEPQPDGSELVMTERVKQHVFELRAQKERLETVLKMLLEWFQKHQPALFLKIHAIVTQKRP